MLSQSYFNVFTFPLNFFFFLCLNNLPLLLFGSLFPVENTIHPDPSLIEINVSVLLL